MKGMQTLQRKRGQPTNKTHDWGSGDSEPWTETRAATQSQLFLLCSVAQ